uniref:Uncharacterized protein n=1 Tax=Dunaliella tertiolecta TaxID=3047 RepID=A0A7S3R5Y3_DUNTE
MQVRNTPSRKACSHLCTYLLCICSLSKKTWSRMRYKAILPPKQACFHLCRCVLRICSSSHATQSIKLLRSIFRRQAYFLWARQKYIWQLDILAQEVIKSLTPSECLAQSVQLEGLFYGHELGTKQQQHSFIHGLVKVHI